MPRGTGAGKRSHYHPYHPESTSLEEPREPREPHFSFPSGNRTSSSSPHQGVVLVQSCKELCWSNAQPYSIAITCAADLSSTTGSISNDNKHPPEQSISHVTGVSLPSHHSTAYSPRRLHFRLGLLLLLRQDEAMTSTGSNLQWFVLRHDLRTRE